MFKDITAHFQPGDVLVVNETRVIPARLNGMRKDSGARVEVLLLNRLNGEEWETLVKPGKKARTGDEIIFGDGEFTGRVIDNTPYGGRVVRFEYDGPFEEMLYRVGEVPLPPYIKRAPGIKDRERYQTVYARREGSAAAPTAGLHFTPRLLEQIKNKGVRIVRILLHVGLGTFRPVKVERVEDHHMHAEYFEIDDAAAKAISLAKKRGDRVIAVGTTTTRCLEAAGRPSGSVNPSKGWTDLFIYPGYSFKVIDAMVTNFHLPKSTLLMMVSAFAGREKILSAYRLAVKERYRFFSYGDAMLII